VIGPVLNTEDRKKKIKYMRFLFMQLKLKLLICVLNLTILLDSIENSENFLFAVYRSPVVPT